MLNIALSQYQIESLQSWQAYENKIVRLVEQAKSQGADLLTLGEYAGLEIASWSNENTLAKQFEFIQSQLAQYLELFSSLAKTHHLYIQAGTIPVKADRGFYNRAYFFSPDGKIAFQDKIHLPPIEQQTTLLQPASHLQLIETSFGKVGICICYDIEFPALVQQLTKAGATLILVPTCTEKLSGLTRVSICARARAIENQCYVINTCLVGKAAWCDFIDINTGLSAAYSPVDLGFPEDGILVQAPLNAPMLTHASLSFDALKHCRERGEIQSFLDGQQYQPLPLYT